MIDWIDITNGYNHINNCKLNEKQMLQTLYDETGSTVKMEYILGINKQTIIKHMRKIGIKILKKGWGRKRKSILYGVDLNGRSAPEISRDIGCCLANVHQYAKRNNMKLKNMKGRCRGMGRTL